MAAEESLTDACYLLPFRCLPTYVIIPTFGLTYLHYKTTTRVAGRLSLAPPGLLTISQYPHSYTMTALASARDTNTATTPLAHRLDLATSLARWAPRRCTRYRCSSAHYRATLLAHPPPTSPCRAGVPVTSPVSEQRSSGFAAGAACRHRVGYWR